MPSSPANSVIVLDFETTGLSPNMGDRAIEIGAVKLIDGEVVETFQQLMNPGCRVSSFIESYTGITNNMLRTAPSCEEVMAQFAEFMGNAHLVAHNASFDKRFLDAELERLNIRYAGQFACSMLIARRLIQDAPTHKLGDLVRYKRIDNDGVFHRALADAEMTAKLWLVMLEELEQKGVSNPSFGFMQTVSKTSKGAVGGLLARARV
ncbi:3'-5' exonuclease [Enterovibrio sp. ZSDZ35]|uniref:DNA-directed DNA polymerase n=1 Tax=Enterovibrio qingdaonensis TaxID=2899818 RepID=A0ABT5QGA2_9GAMM|nr:3'-5' exonuclease [Enterovibrio sp. ZSDZ35]MDD1779884.1 3'-5' exonuclease [Enterovibrio sp. ZSDZ35]